MLWSLIERATGQWHVEWHAIPNAFLIASSSFNSAKYLLEGLEVSPKKMKENIIESASMMGIPSSTDMSKVFEQMGQMVQTLKTQIDKNQFSL